RPAIPAAFEVFQAPKRHANDVYGEVLIGGIKTACLSRADLTRMMLSDCLAGRELEISRPKLVFAVNGHAIALAAQDEAFRRTFESADIIHADGQAAVALVKTYPGLQIVGRRHGYFSLLDEDEICDEINITRPDVIWVGLSVPLEYEFAVRNRARLTAGWLVTCGGCFNFLSG